MTHKFISFPSAYDPTKTRHSNIPHSPMKGDGILFDFPDRMKYLFAKWHPQLGGQEKVA